MICRDFMIRVCHRNPCKMQHKVIMCTNVSCNSNRVCKLIHLTKDEVCEINKNIRPFRLTTYKEMKQVVFTLRESFPTHLRTHTCTLRMLGKCLWPCLACGTASNNVSHAPVCTKCFILLTHDDMKALTCGHAYYKYCTNRLTLQIDGPSLPLCSMQKMSNDVYVIWNITDGNN